MSLTFKRAAALIMALAVSLACVTALVGCMYYYPEQNAGNQQSQQGDGLFTISPEDEAELNKTQPPATANATAAPAATAKATASPTATAKPTATPKPTASPTPKPTECPVKEDGQYDTKDEVALYIHLFGHLPSNYIKKSDAQALGWTGGSLEPYAPGCSIGGDRFGNYEGLLPRKSGRTYYECDIGTKGRSSRGAKRIVFSNDGLIYYTDDHYETFTLLYGED